MAEYGATMRVLRPAENVFAFYDGRIEGVRLYADTPNWLDDGAYSLGVASFAIVDGSDALVYDPHISLPHAKTVRSVLAEQGVSSMRLVLSHFHKDHVAGSEVFADCEIIANELTARQLLDRRADYEAASPPINPLIMPNRVFSGRLDVNVGSIAVELHHFDIHSLDETLAFLPETGLLLAGDALEDTVTYVAEPDRLAHHLADLDRLARLPIRKILPNHGAEAVIAAGGYDKTLIDATKAYVSKLMRCKADPALAGEPLRNFIAGSLADGALTYFEPYEAVHRSNIEAVCALP